LKHRRGGLLLVGVQVGQHDALSRDRRCGEVRPGLAGFVVGEVVLHFAALCVVQRREERRRGGDDLPSIGPAWAGAIGVQVHRGDLLQASAPGPPGPDEDVDELHAETRSAAAVNAVAAAETPTRIPIRPSQRRYRDISR
jgi:hypothetical protein